MDHRIEQAALGMIRGDRARLARDILEVWRLKGWQPLPYQVEEGPDPASWAEQTAAKSGPLVGGTPTSGRRPRFVGGAHV